MHRTLAKLEFPKKSVHIILKQQLKLQSEAAVLQTSYFQWCSLNADEIDVVCSPCVFFLN